MKTDKNSDVSGVHLVYIIRQGRIFIFATVCRKALEATQHPLLPIS
jgi:hypothetical protein